MIQVYDPLIGEEEIAAVVAALRRGELSGTFGESIPQFEQSFAEYVGCRHGISVTSGTTALHLAVAAARLPRGSEILLSASTNIATALAVVYNGCVPVPVDSEEATWNLDVSLIEGLMTERTKAIIPVHLFGHPVDMDGLMAIADRHGLIVIEDAAESHGATVRGRMTGSFGQMSCFSFYANKIITTGEGGMVVTNDDELAERLRLMRNLGFTQPRFRHEVLGFNFRMTGYQAAMGAVQVKRIEDFIAAKRRQAKLYGEAFADLPGLGLPAEASWARNVYWMYGVTVSGSLALSRAKVMERLRELSVDTRTFFCPMSQQPCLEELDGYRAVDCPVADRLWAEGFYLPSGPGLRGEEIQQVIAAMRQVWQESGLISA